MDPLEHEFWELTFAALLKSSLTVSHTWQGMANWGLFLKSWRKSWFVRMQIGSAVWLLQKSMPCSHQHICCLRQPDPAGRPAKALRCSHLPRQDCPWLESDPLKGKPSLNSLICIFSANDFHYFGIIIFYFCPEMSCGMPRLNYV